MRRGENSGAPGLSVPDADSSHCASLFNKGTFLDPNPLTENQRAHLHCPSSVRSPGLLPVWTLSQVPCLLTVWPPVIVKLRQLQPRCLYKANHRKKLLPGPKKHPRGCMGRRASFGENVRVTRKTSCLSHLQCPPLLNELLPEFRGR